MEVYTFILVMIALIYCLTVKVFSAERRNAFFAVSTGVLLALIIGLRAWQSAGIDLERYYTTYTTAAASFANSLMWRDGSSFLYYLLSSVCSVVGIPYQLFISCCSAFFVAASVYFIYKHSQYPLMGILVYLGLGVFVFQFSGLKQAFAMAVSVFAFDALAQKKSIRACIWMIVAMLFHPTAIVLVPLVVAAKIRWTKKLTVVSLVAVGFVFVFRLQIGYLLTLVFRGTKDSYTVSGSVGGTALALLAFLAVYIFLKWEEIGTTDYTGQLPQAVLTFSVMIQLCSSYSYLFTRLNLFYVQFLPAAISAIMSSDGWKRRFGKYEKIVKPAFAALVALVMIMQFYKQISIEGLDGYRFLWESV